MSKIAVLIPCLNEERAIRKVIKDFQLHLPDSDIYVYDNNSQDKTFELAKKTGVIVKKELRQGKGFVIQKMFREIKADIYVLVDGDNTYSAKDSNKMIKKVADGFDMVIGDRISSGFYRNENKRSFHEFGNKLVCFLVNFLFKAKLRDIMSGYRVFSRHFVKNYPVLVGGFQLETDMTIFALDKNFTIQEMPIRYRNRTNGSVSKLNTVSDGVKVLLVIFNLFRYYRPLLYFSSLSVVFLGFGLLVGIPVIYEFFETQYVTKIPSAILAVAFILLSAFVFIGGLILDALRHLSRESFELMMKKQGK